MPAIVANPPVITELISDLDIVNIIHNFSSGLYVRFLLGHGREEGSDEERRFSLAEEDVGRCIH